MKRTIVASIAVFVLVVAGCSSSSPTEAPAELAALIDDWYAANERGDGSVLDLYVPEGYHLYGDQRFEHDLRSDPTDLQHALHQEKQ